MKRLASVLSLVALAVAGCEPPDTSVVAGQALLVPFGFDFESEHRTIRKEDFSLFVFSHPMSCDQFRAWDASFTSTRPASTPEGFSYNVWAFVPAEVVDGEDVSIDEDQILVDTAFVRDGTLVGTGGDPEPVESIEIEHERGRIVATVEGGLLLSYGAEIPGTMRFELDDDPQPYSPEGRYEIVVCPPPSDPPVE